MLVSIAVLVVVGIIVGALATWVMPGPDPGGVIVPILIGVAGSLLGWFAARSVFDLDGIGSIWGILVATLGAIILLAVYRLITRRSV